MTQEIARIQAIFHEALTKPSGAARSTYLIQACDGQAELRERVEALLAAHESSAGFLDFVRTDDATAPISALESIGAEVGPYKLLEQIGEGGFGVVYLAEQRQPLRR